MINNISTLKSILLTDKPILFTGAGFSRGAKTSDKNEFPDGYNLKIRILQDLMHLAEGTEEFNEFMSFPLSDICNHFKQEFNPIILDDYLVNLFSNTQPATFHFGIRDFGWEKIYTTNIDDLIENVYAPGTLVVQNLKRQKTGNRGDKTEYIKLHGCVNNISNGFTFSASEYIDSMLQSQDYRFNQFGLDIQFKNFVFLGTDYNEINLDYYLKLYESANGNSSKGFLFFINPRPSAIFKSKVSRIKGRIIEWTTEEFIGFLEKEVISQLKNEKDFAKLHNFNYINNSIKLYLEENQADSKLYLGFEPKWSDILFDWDFRNSEVEKNFITYLDQIEDKRISHSIYALVGKAMSGKSTYLKRLSHILIKQGYEVYEFYGKDFDTRYIREYIRYNKHTNFCIIIDNGSYFYGAVRDLLKSFPAGKNLIVLTSSRPFFHNKKKYNLVVENFYEHYIDSEINRSFAKEIESKLENKGLLGDLRSLSYDKRISRIIKSNDISSILYENTYGRKFLSRFTVNINKSFQHIGLGKDILIILSIFEKIDLPSFPIQILNTTYSDKIKTIFSQIEDFIKLDNYDGIVLRNSFLCSMILKKTTKSKIVKLIKETLVNISPQVLENKHTYWNEMQAALMKERLLRIRLRFSSDEIKNLLYELKNYYYDNYNYWLQLGIAEQREFDFEMALNHFRQAESLTKESYMVENAIARNFLKQGNYMNDYEKAVNYFSEGERLMLALIENREEFQVKAFSTHSYLHEKIIFLKKFKVTPTDDSLRKLYELLKAVTLHSTDDPIGKQITNSFYHYLKSINKTSIIKVSLQDLSDLKVLFEKYDLDLSSIFDEYELE
ncbi:SIR2 family protein [Pedobacter sp.]|uniref:P-loop NTPase n=1 Tax=Pedobacter sp. TaxID=1411316 RepID=UPI0031E35A51